MHSHTIRVRLVMLAEYHVSRNVNKMQPYGCLFGVGNGND